MFWGSEKRENSILVQKRISASYEPWGSLLKNEKSLPGDQRKATGEAPQGRDRQGGEPPGNRHGSSSVELAAKVLRPPLLPLFA
jgi:hypothetical protein